MEQSLIVKVHIYPTAQQEAILLQTMQAYTDACNWLSKQAFKSDIFTAKELQKLHYQTLRQQFGLKSQMAISAMRTVCAKYKAINEQLKTRPARYDTYSFQRNLDWLQEPVCFHKLFVDLVRTRDWCWKRDVLSLNTLAGRIEVPYNSNTNRGTLNLEWKFGTGTIHKIRKQWYFYIPITLIALKPTEPRNIVGVDRGLKNIIYTYDNCGNSSSVSGQPVQRRRDKFQRTRKSLQSKNTKGAKRVLTRMSGRENRWMNDVNHCLSKTLVRHYGMNTLFVLEDLSKISYKTNRGKKCNHDLSSWSFYDFEQKLMYKARLIQSDVMYVNPHNTSCQCPRCGNVDKTARNRKESLYTCKECGFSANDDLVGAMNIYQRGIAQLNA